MIRKPLTALKARIHRKNALCALAIGIGAFTTTVLMATAPEHAAQALGEKTWPISTTLLEVERIAPELQLFGRVESPRHARLSSAMNAPVLTVHVSEGDRVQAGQPLVTLDLTEASLIHEQRAAELVGAQATLDSLAFDFASEKQVLERLQELQKLAEQRVSRLTDLYARKLVSTTEVDTLRQEAALRAIERSRQAALVDRQPQRLAAARASVRNAQVALDRQQVTLERGTLRAPFNGRVTHVTISVGDQVSQGDSLVAMYDTASLRIRARLPSAIATGMRSIIEDGTAVSATVADSGESAVLVQLAGEIDAGSSGIDAFFNLPSTSSLAVGRAVEMTLRMPPIADVAAVPQQSLHDNGLIYLVEEERLTAVPVTTHGTRRSARGGMEVLVSGPSLRDGAEVLSSDMPEARPGLLVEAARPSDLTESHSSIRG